MAVLSFSSVRWCCLALILSYNLASAQAPCLTLDWEYPTGYDQLGFFRVYVSQTSGVYRFCGNDPTCIPAAMVVAIPSMVTEMPCPQLVVWVPGTYYLVATAVSMDMSVESVASNEISFTIDGLPPLSPGPPIVTGPPTLPPLPLPPPWPTIPPVTPMPSGEGNTISSTRMWQGTRQ